MSLVAEMCLAVKTATLCRRLCSLSSFFYAQTTPSHPYPLPHPLANRSPYPSDPYLVPSRLNAAVDLIVPATDLFRALQVEPGATQDHQVGVIAPVGQFFVVLVPVFRISRLGCMCIFACGHLSVCVCVGLWFTHSSPRVRRVLSHANRRGRSPRRLVAVLCATC